MKRNRTKRPVWTVLTKLLMLGVVTTSATPTIESIKADMKRVADWQIQHIDDLYDAKFRKRPYYPDEWTSGALYVGMARWAAIAGDDSYYKWLLDIAEKQQWKLRAERMYHADDHCIGQLYIELYRNHKKPEMLAPTIEQFDRIMAEPKTVALEWHSKISTDRWCWCDALFMGPPVWAKLSAVTGDPKYRNFMFGEYQAATDFLFDKEENLFYRDSRYFDQRHNGKKIFWSRGNGWVFAGLALIIPELPEGTAQRDYFVGLYKKMAVQLASLQAEEGYWPMSLLEGDTYPKPETSGTGFFCFGFAWGINHGILDRATFEPVALKAWSAMIRCITPDGMLGYVQPVGAEPGESWPDKTELYGTGAFLAAGSELCLLIEHTE